MGDRPRCANVYLCAKDPPLHTDTMSCFRPGFLTVVSAAFLFAGYNVGKQRQKSYIRAHLRKEEAERQAVLDANASKIAALQSQVDALLVEKAKREGTYQDPAKAVKAAVPVAAATQSSDDFFESWFQTANDVAKGGH